MTSKHLYERSFWLTALVAAFTVMIYEMSHVILEYREQRVAADIIPSEVERYPVIVYCPFDWVDKGRADELNFTIDHYLYLESLFICGRLFRHFVSEAVNF